MFNLHLHSGESPLFGMVTIHEEFAFLHSLTLAGFEPLDNQCQLTSNYKWISVFFTYRGLHGQLPL